MIPANRTFTAGSGWAGWAGSAGRAGWSSFRRLDQLVDCLGLVERFPDGETRAHAAIELAALQELLVFAFGGDVPAVEDENTVGIADRRQPVGDHDRRPAGAPALEGGEHDLFRDRVERRGRLVEDQNRRVLD